MKVEVDFLLSAVEVWNVGIICYTSERIIVVILWIISFLASTFGLLILIQLHELTVSKSTRSRFRFGLCLGNRFKFEGKLAI